MPQTNLDQFSLKVLQDPLLGKELRAITDPTQFPAVVAQLAQKRGFAFSSAEAAAAIQVTRRAWFERFCVFDTRFLAGRPASPPPVKPDVSQLAGYIPIGVYWRRSQPVIDWCYRGETRFTEPFFDQTVTQLLRQPFNQLFRPNTPIDTLLEWAAHSPGITPTGFVFHVSRCGSTLVSQMLAALPENIAISEAGPIDAILRANLRTPGLTEDEHVAWFRAMVSAMAQPMPGQTHFFIKFDCINTLHLPLIRRAFPDVPWIFLYRNPVEVMVSQIRQRGGLLLPWAVEPALLGWNASYIQSLSLDEYGAALLGKICEAGIENFEPCTGRLIDYKQLPDAVNSLIANHFGISFSPEQERVLQKTTQVHAKNPQALFTGDSAGKQNEAKPEVHQLVERFLAAPYARLESLRCASKTTLRP